MSFEFSTYQSRPSPPAEESEPLVRVEAYHLALILFFIPVLNRKFLISQPSSASEGQTQCDHSVLTSCSSKNSNGVYTQLDSCHLQHEVS